MSRKTVEDKVKYDDKGLTILGKMNEGQYWKWRLTIEEMEHALSKQNMIQSECKIKSLEIEKSQLQLIISRQKFQEAQRGVLGAKEEYDNVAEEIRKKLKLETFKGCIIDPYTFEIKEAPKQDT